MSVKLLEMFRRTALGIVMLLCVSPAQGSGLLDDASKFLEDPLNAFPQTSISDVPLPNDGMSIVCPAHKNFAEPLILAEAVDLALCNNAQVQAAWIATKVQAAAVGEAKSAYFPTLSGSVSRLNDHTSYPGSPFRATTLSSKTLYANLTWRLFDFGGRNANHAAANCLLEAALKNHEATLQKTLGAIVFAYFEAQTAKATWTAKEYSEANLRDILEVAKRRESKGSGAQTDTLQVMTALAKASLEKSRAWGSYQKTLSTLIYTMGLAANIQLVLAEDRSVTSQEYDTALTDWLEQTKQLHPAIAAARAQLAASQQKRLASRAEGLPTLDLIGNVYQNGRPNQGLSPTRTQETTLGITLNVPIFEGFLRTYKNRGAEALVEQREMELLDVERQILMEVVKAHADSTTALANLTASESFLVSAQALFSSVQRKFSKGAADMTEVLNTQVLLSEAQQERVRCLAEWRSARLRLFASAGMMGRQLIQP